MDVMFFCHVLEVHWHVTLRRRVSLSTWNACQTGTAAAVISADHAHSVLADGGTD